VGVILFSNEELNFLMDETLFPLKRTVSDKIIDIFDDVESRIRKEILSAKIDFPDNFLLKNGKISRGENYNNQPYIVLDFPRSFDRNNIFTYRTIFWWGNYFSNSIIFSGSIYKTYENKILNGIDTIRNKGWLISFYSTPWKLEVGINGLSHIQEYSNQQIKDHLKKQGFINITRIHKISEYQTLPLNSSIFFHDLLDLLF